MGLDLVVEGCAKPGQEAEWRSLLERAFAEVELTAEEIDRFQSVSIPAYERLDAPRVGFDPAADAWIIEARKAATPDEVAAVLKAFHGYHALRLVTSDGLPAYSHGGLYDGVDETSFRGAFRHCCGDVLGQELIEQAYEHRLPEAAIDYGRALLAAADTAEAAGPPPKPPPKIGILARLGLAKPPEEPEPFEQQLEIVRAAGRWFVFWGERGHAIRAWT